MKIDMGQRQMLAMMQAFEAWTDLYVDPRFGSSDISIEFFEGGDEIGAIVSIVGEPVWSQSMKFEHLPELMLDTVAYCRRRMGSAK